MPRTGRDCCALAIAAIDARGEFALRGNEFGEDRRHPILTLCAQFGTDRFESLDRGRDIAHLHLACLQDETDGVGRVRRLGQVHQRAADVAPQHAEHWAG